MKPTLYNHFLTIMKIDAIGWQILSYLQQNARASFSDIGRKVGLSSPAVAERVKKMEDFGIIQGYQAVLSHALAGYQLKALIMVRAFAGKLKPFLEKIKSFDEIVNCYRITGNENIIMEVVIQDQAHLETFIDQLIVYGECRTHIVLSSIVRHAPITSGQRHS